MKKLLLSFVSVMVLFCVGATAQVTTSGIGGHIYGASDQPLAGAVVKAVHTPTGTTYYTTTLNNGRYVISGMRVGGPYVIEVEYMGYTSEKRNNVQLALGEEAAFNFTLKEGAANLGEIVVSADNNAVFSATRTGSEEIITSQTMLRMPSVNRSLSDYTRLAPTSSGTEQGNSFGGISGRYNNMTVDGASFNNSFGLSATLGSNTIEPVSLESIEQIQVMISPFDVRNGGFTGGGVNSVTKSGTNEWSATAYLYNRGPKLTGLKQNDFKAERAEGFNRQFGVSLSGPIIQNKLFFFLNGEMDRQGSPINWRPSNGSEASGVGTGVSTVTQSELNDIAKFLGDKFSYSPGSSNVSEVPIEGNRITARIDWNINSRNTLSFKYFFLKSFATNSPSSSNVLDKTSRQASENTIPFSSSYYRGNNNFNIFMADLNTKINDRLRNTLTVGFSALRDFRDMDGGFFPSVDIVDAATPRTITSFGTEPYSYNNRVNTNLFQIQNNLQMLAGDHDFTFGVYGDLRKFTNGFQGNGTGYWRFGSFDSFKQNVDEMAAWLAAGNAPKDFAPTAGAKPLMYTETYAVTDDGSFAYLDMLQFGFYAQDKWSIRPNLHLTYGIRFDIPVFLSDIAYNKNWKDKPLQYGETIDTSVVPSTKLQISPRIGVNWDVFSDRTLQVRGGVGLFAGTPPFVWLSNQASNTGLLFNSTTVGTNAGFTGQIGYYSTPEPNNYSQTIAVTDKDFKYPKVFKGSVAADWRFWDDWILSGEFLYSKNINDIYHRNINLADPAGYVQDYPGSEARPYFTKNRLQSNAQYVIAMSNTSKGYAAYTTFKLQKNFNYGTLRGLQFSGAYTFGVGKAVTDGSSAQAQSAWRYRPALDPNSEELGYTVGAFRDRFIFTLSYRKEYAKHFASGIGLVYDRYTPYVYGITPRYSYTYLGDVNGDGERSNDLIYIPRTKAESNLSDESQWDALNAFIEQDPYLSTHRGQYAERNSALIPKVNRVDLNFTQDFFVTMKSGQRNTIRLSVDIRNLGNLLNKNWGVIRKVSGTGNNQQFQFLNVDSVTESTPGSGVYVPKFSFVPTPNNSTYTDFISAQSRWGLQFGIKYIFN